MPTRRLPTSTRGSEPLFDDDHGRVHAAFLRTWLPSGPSAQGVACRPSGWEIRQRAWVWYQVRQCRKLTTFNVGSFLASARSFRRRLRGDQARKEGGPLRIEADEMFQDVQAYIEDE